MLNLIYCGVAPLLNDQTNPAFEGLVGKPNTRGIKAGVYIFTHIISGDKYVGSTNSLSRRLVGSALQYFIAAGLKHFNPINSGLLIPLINKYGLFLRRSRHLI